jgi:hypothetical protein
MDSPFVEIIKHTAINRRNISEPLDELLGKLSPEKRSAFEQRCIERAIIYMVPALHRINATDQKVVILKNVVAALDEIDIADQCVDDALAWVGNPYNVRCNCLDAVFHAVLAQVLADGHARSFGQENASWAVNSEREFQYNFANELKSGGTG